MHGTTDYGDCVEDEWLIVYLLRELTKSFGNLWARISDSDGEFLLVEAANVLPKWLSPEIDGNRVWIQNGKLRIIPIADGASLNKRSLSLPNAIKALEYQRSSLVHSTFIEAEAFYRLEKYPSQITASLHHSRVTIPRKLACVIHDRPKSISPATEAFYVRDPLSLKPLISESPSLAFPPTDLVTVSVRFTRVLFAQLRSQRFDPPPTWAPLISSAETKAAADMSEDAQRLLSQLEMGMKVTCGFEMLAKKASKSDNRVIREVGIILEDLEEDGDSVLPTDADISTWKDANREDDDSWMDINYEDFERELDGKQGGGTRQKDAKPAFGDANTQADLRKIVSRFETFLNDEQAGVEGAEVEEMDHDDDDEEDDELDSDGEDSEGEDREVSFDEEQFANMMREMMGLPSESGSAQKGKGKEERKVAGSKSGVVVDSDAEAEEKEIKELMLQMESELNQHGALDLDPKPKKPAALDNKVAGQRQEAQLKDKGAAADEEEESGDDEVNIDYNLAKNLLESFKSQAGMAGPAGNILSMMGMRLPRDEDPKDDEQKGA